jgi:hypothetical protein
MEGVVMSGPLAYPVSHRQMCHRTVLGRLPSGQGLTSACERVIAAGLVSSERATEAI